MTRLSTFIRDNAATILVEWETFARNLPAAGSMDIASIRDHAREMLDGIAHDLDTPQTPQRHAHESKGQTDSGDESARAAQEHGAARAEHGFTIAETVAEFRALRATVILLWTAQTKQLAGEDLDDVTKFHEALDQAIAESITRYTEDLGQSKDRFLGILGHDLRTPLSSIVMSADFLLETGELQEPTLGMVTKIATSGKRMSQMVADLVDFARTQFGGDMPIARGEMDLRTMIDEVASEVAASHPKSQIHIDASGELRGTWDRNRLAQALTNLIANAVDHGSHESPINVTAEGTEDDVVVSVQNQGPVIPPEKLGQVFAASGPDTTDTPHRNGHLGLGLYIVDSIIRAHGGTIDADSSEARGTTFTVRLPRQASTHEALTAHT